VLWQEEVKEEIPIWSVDRFGRAAQDLGRFNGLFLAEQPLPQYDWLTRDIVQQKERRGEYLANLDKLRQYQIVRKGWPDDVLDGIQHIWRKRKDFYRVLKRLPQTLYHGDARRRNLMSRTGKNGNEETVAIDWGMGGIGAVGEEIASTVFSSTYWFEDVEVTQLPELEKKVLDGYFEGLCKAGWRGNLGLAYLGYLCAVALRYGPLIISPEVMSIGVDVEQRAKVEKRFGWTIEEWADSLVQLRRFVIQRADKASVLMTNLEL
jgi:hypothetical protein